MHRIDHPTKAADLHGAGKDGFTEGDPVAGVAATVVTDDILNAFQEEIANTIEARGEALDKLDNTQLKRLIGDALSAIEAYVVADEWTYPAPKTRTLIFGQRWFRLGTAGDGTPHWAKTDGGVTGPICVPVAGASIAKASIYFELPDGAVITAVRVLYSKHSDHVTASDRWQFRLEKLINWDFSPATPPGRSIIGAQQDGGAGTGDDVVEWTGLAEVVDNSDTTYHVAVEGPSVEGANDRLHGIEVTFSDPGPRNF